MKKSIHQRKDRVPCPLPQGPRPKSVRHQETQHARKAKKAKSSNTLVGRIAEPTKAQYKTRHIYDRYYLQPDSCARHNTSNRYPTQDMRFLCVFAPMLQIKNMAE